MLFDTITDGDNTRSQAAEEEAREAARKKAERKKRKSEDKKKRLQKSKMSFALEEDAEEVSVLLRLIETGHLEHSLTAYENASVSASQCWLTAIRPFSIRNSDPFDMRCGTIVTRKGELSPSLKLLKARNAKAGRVSPSNHPIPPPGIPTGVPHPGRKNPAEARRQNA